MEPVTLDKLARTVASGYFSIPDLAVCFGRKEGPLRKLLEKFRADNPGDPAWLEVANRQKNHPRFLFQGGVVMQIILANEHEIPLDQPANISTIDP